jgi:hypothetical protein
MTQHQQINEIHEQMINGNRKNAVKLMQAYSMYDFFNDYANFLSAIYNDKETEYSFFQDAANSYLRITNK